MKIPYISAICQDTEAWRGTRIYRRQRAVPRKYRGFWGLTHSGSRPTVEDGFDVPAEFYECFKLFVIDDEVELSSKRRINTGKQSLT